MWIEDISRRGHHHNSVTERKWEQKERGGASALELKIMMSFLRYGTFGGNTSIGDLLSLRRL